MMVRWWWFGPSVTKPELEREMRSMKEGGIGGFEVQPTYPLTLDDPQRGLRNFPYLSDEFLDDLRFTGGEGARARPALRPHAGQRLAIRRPAHPAHPGGRAAAGGSRARARECRVGAGPTVAEGEKFIAAFLARGDQRQFAAEGIRRLTEIANGAVRVPAEAGQGRVVLFFIASRTRQMVKRAAVGAEGFVLDHYDRAAIDTHLKSVGDRC